MRRKRAAEQTPAGDAVNLLSPWVLEDLRLRALRRRFVYGALAMVMLVAAGWAFQRMNLHTAEADLAAEQSSSLGLQQQIAAMAPVQAYVAAVNLRAGDVEGTMRDEVSFSRALAALQVAAPSGVTMQSVSVSLLPSGAVSPDGTTAPPVEGTTLSFSADPAATADPSDTTRGLSGAGCPGPDPFAVEPSIGCMTITGTAGDRETVGRLVSALSKKGAFVEPFISTTSTDAATTGLGGGDSLTFTGTVGLTPVIFTGRYDDLSIALGLKDAP